jgi:hypothetical protein
MKIHIGITANCENAFDKIIDAIIEQQEHGQLCHQTIEELKEMRK